LCVLSRRQPDPLNELFADIQLGSVGSAARQPRIDELLAKQLIGRQGGENLKLS
jgi:hypothetical protein